MVKNQRSVKFDVRRFMRLDDKRPLSPWLRFAPLLILYTLIILFYSSGILEADEPRYVMYAENILAGQYTDPDMPELQNAPGYPLYLALFLALGLPLGVPKLLNAGLMFLAVVFFYKSLKIYVSEKSAVLAAYALGLYYPMFRWLIYNISEALSIVVICAFMYFALKALRRTKITFTSLLIPALLLGYLILVKLFYQYVVLFSFLFTLAAWLVYRRKKLLGFSAILIMGYLVAAVPYLSYTYSITGKTFYWGTQTGQKIYWMTVPYEGEFGKWFPMDGVIEGRFPELHPDHRKLFTSLEGMTPMEKNEALVRISKDNIKKYPGNYLFNIIPNTLRLLFAYPMHLHPNLNMYYYAGINSLLFIPFLFSLVPAWIYRRRIPTELYALMLFSLIYFGGLCLIPTVPRYLFMMVPAMLLWTAFVLSYFVKISFPDSLPGRLKSEG